MEIILGKTAGFCYGVKRAVEEAKKYTDNNKKIYCLGELVHNKSVIEDLEKRGLKFISNIDEASEEIIIRAHGESKETYQKLNERNIKIKDLTCPKVLNTHKIAEEYSKKNYFIILIGIKDHPESIGTLSYCKEKSFLIQEKEDIKNAIEKINQSNIENVLIMAQTTYNSKKFDIITQNIKDILVNKNIEIKKTICGATEIRQKETIELAKNVDAMIIVGDKKSSNTNKLYDISKENCKNVFFVQNADEIDKKSVIKFKKIGVMAGASTPKEDIDNVINKLKE